MRETIDDISRGFEEPAIQAEIIPEREAKSLKRLLERQANHALGSQSIQKSFIVAT